MTGKRSDALLVFAHAAFFGLRVHIAELSASHRLPAMDGARVNVEAGG